MRLKTISRSPFHKLAAVAFLVLAVCLCLNAKAYTKTYVGSFAWAEFPFLQAGDYSVTVTCEGISENCDIIVRTDALVDESNQQGVILAEIPLFQDGITNFIFHLPESAEAVEIRNSMGEEAHIFQTIQLQSVQLLDKDNYFLGAACFFAAIAILLLGFFVPAKRYKLPVILICMGLAASIPYFNDFLKWGHDLNFHLARLEGIYQAMRSGSFPVFVNPHQMEGFGNLSGTMYPQLFLYPAAMLRFLGLSTVLCYKLLIVGANIATAFLTYYSIKNVCRSERIGLCASVLYTFSSYRLADIYTRAALGELLAMMFFPLIIWGIYEVLWGEYKKWYLLALGVTGVLQSHVLSMEISIFFLILTVLAWLLQQSKTVPLKRIFGGLKAVAFTILLNAFFLVPFLYFCGEDLQVFGVQNDLSLSTAYLSQLFPLFMEATGSNLISGGTKSEMPIAVGGVLLAAACLFLVEYLRKRKEDRSTADQIGMGCLAFGMAAILLSSWLFPWKKVESVPFLDFVVSSLEFVWRCLGPASILWSVAGAVGLVSFASRPPAKEWIYGIFLAVVLCSTGFYFDQVSHHLDDMSDKMLISGIDETGDNVYLYNDDSLQDYSRRNANIQCSNDSVVLYSDYKKSGTNITVQTSVEQYVEGARLLFPLYDYTGYEVTVNGEKVEVYRQNSRVACDLPQKDAMIRVRYAGLSGFLIGYWISFITILASVFWCAGGKKLLRRGRGKALDES